MRLIDGRAIAAAMAVQVRAEIAELQRPPALAVVLPSDDEAAKWYTRSIGRAVGQVGISCQVESLAGADEHAITRRLDELSADPAVDGIICQTPLPPGIGLQAAGEHIDPAKDVDGANPASLGRVLAGMPAFAPATAAAVLRILRDEQVAEHAALDGARAVVVGRSTVVGKPVALLLLAANATVTVCHSRTPELAAECARADVLVAAAGRAGLIGAGHIKPGAVVIDVGTNPVPGGGLTGDVDAGGAAAAAALTPVPGGAGPVTTMMLMLHTVRAATCRGRVSLRG